MRYFNSTILCICLVIAFLAPVNVNAADNTFISVPSVIFDDSTSYPIDLIGQEREENKLIIYTRKYGEFTKPFTADTHEFIIVNNIVVNKSTSETTGTYIPTNGYVLSFTGKEADLPKRIIVGEELKLSGIDIPIAPDMYFKLGDLTVPIDQINTVRDAGQVVLYNPSYGATTRTNPWGLELTVVDGKITGLADISNQEGKAAENNSLIPAGGMVISIHSGSSYYKQVQEKAKPGDAVQIYDDSTKLYSAATIVYAAKNPLTIADNPAAWDAAEGKPYDSFRGPNQLIIYDSNYGNNTGTNAYGYEVSVSSDGKIISTGGNDSRIPIGGYILSGHGDKLNWLKKNALLGASVAINPDKKEVVILLTPDSYINRASYSIRLSQDRLDLAKLQYQDIPYDKVQSIIDMAQSKLKDVIAKTSQGQYESLVGSVKEIQKQAEIAYYSAFESVKVENRAIWLRPKETNVDAVRKKLDMLKELNINTVYLETYYNGYAIYPTGNELMQQNPIFNGFDVLDAYVKEAHARGIELHSWVENFLVGRPIAEKKPEWMAVSRKGDTYYMENGTARYDFLNPALPEVRDFLSDLYKELVKKYPIDGVQLDYMRYSHSGDYSNDFGYDTYTRQLFKSYTGRDPITLGQYNPLWKKWCQFRADVVNSYAYRLISELKSLKPGLQISADVWPEYDKTLVDIYQNPKAWTRQDYINTLVPMSYYLHEGPVVDDLINTWAFSRGHSQVASGIATFTKIDKQVLIRQIDAVRAANTNGIAVFEFDSLFNGGYDEILKLGAFSTPSAVTDRNPEQSIRKVLDEIIRKIDDVYLPHNGMDIEQADKYNKLIGGLDINFKNGEADAVYTLRNDIYNLQKVLTQDAGVNAEVIARINTDMNTAINILDAYISNLRFKSEHKVKEFQLELPFGSLAVDVAIPVKVRAVFNDNTIMYLDETQYTIKSSNPTAAELTGNMLTVRDEEAPAVITVDILDAFRLSTENGLDSKIEFAVNKKGTNTIRVLETGYTKVILDWGSEVVDSDIAGYAVYRDDKEIVRIPSSSFSDKDLQPGGTYIYYVYGFDAEGNVVYESSPLTVKTKELFLLAEH